MGGDGDDGDDLNRDIICVILTLMTIYIVICIILCNDIILHRQNHTLKFYLFKMFNVTAMYLSKWLYDTRQLAYRESEKPAPGQLKQPVEVYCELDSIGRTYVYSHFAMRSRIFYMLILDITVVNVFEFVIPLIILLTDTKAYEATTSLSTDASRVRACMHSMKFIISHHLKCLMSIWRCCTDSFRCTSV